VVGRVLPDNCSDDGRSHSHNERVATPCFWLCPITTSGRPTALVVADGITRLVRGRRVVVLLPTPVVAYRIAVPF
jgi:hypothetical protein